MGTIDTAFLMNAIAELLEEVHVGPPNPKGTWLVSNTAESGVLGTLSRTSAATASRAPAPGMNTIAANTEHLRYSLSLARRAIQGENPYANADWPGSWRIQNVDQAGWDGLRAELKREHSELLAAMSARETWTDLDLVKGVLALIGHGAYHLGAIRQLDRLFAAKVSSA